jgi:putative membrane protein
VRRKLFIAVSVSIIVTVGAITHAAQKIEANERAFLQKAAQEQLAEIALGKLAMKKAVDAKLKEFGAEIVEDHQYASQELKDLSAREGLYLPVEMSAQQKKVHQRLSHLSGNEFDKAFIAYLQKNHRHHVVEFQEKAAQVHNDKVRQWVEATQPILAVHLNKAETVAEALGVQERR